MTSAAPPVTLGPLGQITSRVHDLPRAIAFYRDTLGLRQLPIPAPTLAFFDCGAGIRLMLSGPEGAETDHPGSVLYFRVTDIQGTARALTERGVIMQGEPHLIARMPDHDLWMAFFKDPDENPLALMAELPH